MNLPIRSWLDEVLSQLDLGHSFPKKVLFWGEGIGGIASYVAGWMAGREIDVIVLDGANRFDPYIASAFARRALIPPEKVLKRIQIARAFTCYQMATLMGERLFELIERERSGSSVYRRPWVILLGPVTTFLDEDVPEREASSLFERALSKMEKMAAAGMSFFLFQSPISNSPHPPFTKEGFSKRAYLMKKLAQFSDLIWRITLGDEGPKMILEKRLPPSNKIFPSLPVTHFPLP